mgnify:CR=1 FL=1
MSKYQYTKDIVYSQVFNLEILEYFDTIATPENSIWIDKYFNILLKNENIIAKKYHEHHIRPCCTFKDETHRNRRESKPLADKINGNIIKLSIYNHLFAHFYLWKIFNNQDSKTAFQRMCGQGKYIDNLTENELKDIAKLKEECAKRNQTEKEKKYIISTTINQIKRKLSLEDIMKLIKMRMSIKNVEDFIKKEKVDFADKN